MAKRTIAAGQKFGRLSAIRFHGRSKSGRKIWLFACHCGEEFPSDPGHVATGHTTSCGCLKRSGLRRDPVADGARFGRLVALGEYRKNRHNQYAVRCRCDCGEQCWVTEANLKNGHTQSCGCLSADTAAANVIVTSFVHGHARHGSVSREYRSWTAMINRCEDSQNRGWRNYGGRGITVCDRWRKSFVDFFADMGPRPAGHSIDRIDPDGNYEPRNCRWADARTQRLNTRKNKMKEIAYGSQIQA